MESDATDSVTIGGDNALYSTACTKHFVRLQHPFMASPERIRSTMAWHRQNPTPKTNAKTLH